MARSAPVSVRPTPETYEVSKKQKIDGSELNLLQIPSLRGIFTSPSSLTKFMPFSSIIFCMILSKIFVFEKINTLCP